MTRTEGVVAMGILLGLSGWIAGCEDTDKKKADLVAKTGSVDAAAVVAPPVIPTASAPASAAAPRQPARVCPPDDAFVVDDPDLEAELRLKLSKPKDKNPGPLTTADLANVRSLNLTKKTSLDDLDACLLPKLTGLKHLYLGPGKYRDLKPIAGLTQLESLRASISEVSDLRPLEKLVLLDRLDLGRTHVRDLGPLANLVNLTELQLDDTQVTDVVPLAKCKKLEKLSIKHTNVTDASPLKDLTHLKFLYVEGTALSNVDKLEPLVARGLRIVTK